MFYLFKVFFVSILGFFDVNFKMEDLKDMIFEMNASFHYKSCSNLKKLNDGIIQSQL